MEARLTSAFSPDPYLSSTLSFLTVKGMQESGLITCAKHYILYEQEPVCTGAIDSDGGRTDCSDVSSEVDGGCRWFAGLSTQTRLSKSCTCRALLRASVLGPGR